MSNTRQQELEGNRLRQEANGRFYSHHSDVWPSRTHFVPEPWLHQHRNLLLHRTVLLQYDRLQLVAEADPVLE